MYRLALKARNVRPRVNAPVLHVVEQFTVDGRVRLKNFMIRLRQTIVRIFSNRDAQKNPQENPLRPHREPRLNQFRRWNPEQGLWQKPVAAPQADPRRISHPRRLRGNVARGVPSANHQHALSRQLRRGPVILRVNELALELSRIIWKAPVPVMPVANDQPFVDALLAAR